MHFDHEVGCDQGGPQPPAEGWYVDNVFEECDAPGEYYFSSAEKALYYTFNATEGPTGDESFALTTTKIIFNVSGTQARPVRNVTIRGLTIRDAALTYLGTTDADIHYNPSDSDWVIQRSGAVLLQGTEGFVFEQNHVTRCDGNGLFLSDYNRNASVVGNEFSFTGDNAMSSFGSTGRCPRMPKTRFCFTITFFDQLNTNDTRILLYKTRIVLLEPCFLSTDPPY